MGLGIRFFWQGFDGNLPYTAFWTRAFGGTLRYEWESNWRAFLVDDETGVRTSLWGNTFTPLGWGKLTGWHTLDADGKILNRVVLPKMGLQDLLQIIDTVRDGDLAPLLDLMAAPPSGVSYLRGLTPANMPTMPEGVDVMPVKVDVRGNGSYGPGSGSPADDDVIVTGRVWGSYIEARSGNDRIETDGDAGAFHQVWAGFGNDTVIAGGGVHLIGGGDGDDLIDARGAAAGSRIGGGFGNDTIMVEAAAEVWGGPVLWGVGADDDLILGGTGDLVAWAGNGNDTVTGGSGNDRLMLGPGNDRGHGGAGDDTLIPGPGADVLSGGAGSDVFVIRHLSGWNRITDFSMAEVDRLFLGRGLWEPRFGAMTAEEVVQTFGQIVGGHSARLDFGSADAIVLLSGITDLDRLADHIVIL
jgi:Ca2+-binding RTX toxin-like protein